MLRRIETRGPPESLSPGGDTAEPPPRPAGILAKLMDLDVQIETRLTNYGATVNRLVSQSVSQSLTHSLSWSLKSLQTQTTQPSHPLLVPPLVTSTYLSAYRFASSSPSPHACHPPSAGRNWAYEPRGLQRQEPHHASVVRRCVHEPRVQPARYTPYAYFRAGQQSLAHDGDDLAGFLSEQAGDE